MYIIELNPVQARRLRGDTLHEFHVLQVVPGGRKANPAGHVGTLAGSTTSKK